MRNGLKLLFCVFADATGQRGRAVRPDARRGCGGRGAGPRGLGRAPRVPCRPLGSPAVLPLPDRRRSTSPPSRRPATAPAPAPDTTRQDGPLGRSAAASSSPCRYVLHKFGIALVVKTHQTEFWRPLRVYCFQCVRNLEGCFVLRKQKISNVILLTKHLSFPWI